MNDRPEKSQHELDAALRALEEARARLERQNTEHRLNALELEESRSALQILFEDLEHAHRQTEQAHQEWIAALDVVKDPILLHDPQFRILRCNRAYQQCAGIPFKEIIGRLYYEVFPRSAAPLPCCLRATEKYAEQELLVGEVFYRARAYSIHDENGAALYCVHVLEDISERKQTEKALRDSRESLERLLNSMAEGAYGVDTDGNCTFVNRAFLQMLGYRNEDELLGKHIHELIHHSHADGSPYPASECRMYRAYQTHQPINVSDEVFWRKDGVAIPVEYWSHPIISGGVVIGAIATFIDITGRKKAEEVLRDSEEQYRTMIENSNDMIWTLAPDGRFTFINQQAADATGRTIEEWLGQSFEPLVLEDDLPMVLEIHGKIMSGEKVHYEVRGKKADGEILILSVNASPVYKDGKVNGTISFASDITERKRAEIATQHANRALAALSAVNRSLVRAVNEDELLQSICQAIVERRGYQMAWVGYAQQDAEKSIKVMAYASSSGGYPDTMHPTWAEGERGAGPSGRAIRSGATQLCQDIAGDAHYRPWREAALQFGYASSIALPLPNTDNSVFGVLVVYSKEANAFSPAEVDLLEEMAGDMAFGVRALKTRSERDLALQLVQQHLVQLQGSLEDTVRAIASIVEMRDPYTAGHQARVADLAVAIATQMGLPAEQVHGIHLAGIVHDLGKIHIPAEILSKPGKITEMEYSFIKTHAQFGYDILKDIEFPWPIAQMVWQHHERLDGSGYPQGLKGDAILLEARILSVADVVEAISSHRPYRAGLGAETALAEITRQRGVFFDAAVVDACLTLFREKQYSLI